jgi:hypothetical protein
MPDTNAMLQDGVAALKAGRKADAKRILTQIVDTQEDNEEAWLWLSACVDTPEEQQICLENVIAINPNNQKARKGLEAISKRGTPKSAGTAAPPPPAPAPPQASQFPVSDGDFFTGFNSSTSASPASSGSATSVEWGNPSAPAAYGSGKNVQLPSDEEYDNWVTSLNLGGSGSGSSPFTTGFDTNFDSFEAPDAGSPFDNPETVVIDDPFGSSSFSFDKPAASIGSKASSGGTNAPDSFSSFDSGFGAPASSGSSFDSFGSDSFGSPGGFDDADPFGSAGGSFGSSSAPSRSDPFGSQSSGGFSFDFGSDSASPAISEDSLVDDPFGSSSSFGSSSGGGRDDSAADLFSNLPHSKSKGKSGSSSRSSASNVDDLFDDEQFSPPPTVDDLFDDDFGGGRFTGDDEFAEPSTGGFVFGKSTGQVKFGSQAYFKAIPEEIEAGGGFSLGKMDKKLALAVGGLGLLNAASLAAMVLALSGR